MRPPRNVTLGVLVILRLCQKLARQKKLARSTDPITQATPSPLRVRGVLDPARLPYRVATAPTWCGTRLPCKRRRDPQRRWGDCSQGSASRTPC